MSTSHIKETPPVEVLREWLDYDAETGEFRWKKYRNANCAAGSIAGFVAPSGYRIISFGEYGRYMAHRLAWRYFHKLDPFYEIDHIDGNRDNNAIANLREATRLEQSRNRRINRNNKSGLKGVHFVVKAQKWKAVINVERRAISLGLHDTPEAAYAAYCAAAREHFGEFAKTA